MSEGRKTTVGKAARDLMMKDPTILKDPIGEVRDIRDAVLEDYIKKLESTIEEGCKAWPGDFFVVVASKVERTMHNVIRNLIFHRRTCPTPNYDQIVYKYICKTDEIEFIWAVPDKASCEYIKKYPFEVPDNYKDLMKTVFDFYDDTLLNIAKHLNGEESEDLIKEIYG